jgi:hypothetical protein
MLWPSKKWIPPQHPRGERFFLGALDDDLRR